MLEIQTVHYWIKKNPEYNSEISTNNNNNKWKNNNIRDQLLLDLNPFWFLFYSKPLPNIFIYCLLFRIFVATKDSWIDTDYYHSDQFHPMQMTYHPPGSPQSEHHGQIHDNERNHKVYIPHENEVRPGSIPNRRRLLRQSQNFRGNTYFRQISRR